MAGELELQRLAARQHGLASREQLMQIGFTRRQLERRNASGRWLRLAPRVYDVAPGSLDPRRPLHAAVLSSGGWASHRSAGELLGLFDARPKRPELVVAEGRHPRGIDAVVHQSRSLGPRERTTVDGIACSSVARTLLDLASVVDGATLDDAVSRALTTGQTSLARLDRYLTGSLAGRRRVVALRETVDRHRDRQQLTQSLLEAIVDRAVADGSIPTPHRQLPVVVGAHEFRLDLAWPEAMVFVEADGFAFHSSRRQFQRDRERQNLLVVAGWLPLRYTWAVAMAEPRLIVRQLGKILPGRSRPRALATSGR